MKRTRTISSIEKRLPDKTKAMELDLIKKKIIEIVETKPQKAAVILSSWIKKKP